MPSRQPIAEKLADSRCPKCAQEMEHGFVAGNRTRLRWVPNPNAVTVFAGVQLHIPFRLWTAPSYEGYRCDGCGLVVFSYDP